MAALPAILESDGGLTLFDAGAEALQMSTIPPLTLISKIGEGRTLTLVRSLPSTLVELLLVSPARARPHLVTYDIQCTRYSRLMITP